VPMADVSTEPQAGQVVRAIQWREVFPFTHIFRSFKVAIHPSKLGLALLGLLLIYAGGRFLDAVWPRSHRAVPNELEMYEGVSRGWGARPSARDTGAAASDDIAAAMARVRLGGAMRATGRAGATEGDFEEARVAERESIVRDYASALQELHVDNLDTREKAEAAAREGKYLGAVKDQLKKDRDARVKEAEEQYKKDKEAKVADAGERLKIAKLAAYREAAARWDDAKRIKGRGLFDAFFNYEAGQVNDVARGVLAGNWLGSGGVVSSVRNFLTVGPVWALGKHPLYFILFFIWFLVVWAVFGGAIARIAAVHVARDEKLSVRSALAFSFGKFLSFLFAPIIPLIIVVVVGIVVLVGGLIANIPVIGPIVVGALLFLALAAGFVMALVLLGLAGGFNLMYPTIAVEGSDSFDAISRSFSYLYGRPWRLGFYTAVAIAYGAITYLFVRLFIYLMLGMAHHFAGMGVFTDAASGQPLWQALWPGTHERLAYDIDFFSLNAAQDTAAFLIAFWVYLTIGLLGAYVISFYFSANTIIYYLMRQEVDATDLDDVYLEQSDEEFGDLAPVTTGDAAPAPAGATLGTTTVVTPATPSGPTPGTAAQPEGQPGIPPGERPA